MLSFVAVGIAALVVALPSDHPCRATRNLALVLAASFVVGVRFFWAGSMIRNHVAAASGFASSGTQVVTPAEFVPYALKRPHSAHRSRWR